MKRNKHERTPLNIEGDFYVKKDMCLSCVVPELIAPELMGYDSEIGCYFKKQPQNSEEIDHAVEAIWSSCIEALRYAGSDPDVLERMRNRGCKSASDVLSA